MRNGCGRSGSSGATTIASIKHRYVDATFFGINNTTVPLNPTPATTFKSLRLLDLPGILWSSIETSAGSYNWTSMDSYVNSAFNAGYTLIMTLASTPTLGDAVNYSVRPTEVCSPVYGGNGRAAEPGNIMKFANFCTAIATRYVGRIKYYELWNEPDYTPSSDAFFSGSPTALAQMARVGYTALKSADPNCVVLSPACNGTTGPVQALQVEEHLGAFLAASDGAGGTGADWVDAIAFHYYPQRLIIGTNIQQRSLASIPMIHDAVVATMYANGIGDKDIYCTEQGVVGGSNRPYFTELSDSERQRFVYQLLSMSLCLGHKMFLWWDYTNPWFGLCTASRTTADVVAQGAIETIRAAVSGKTINGSIIYDGKRNFDISLSDANTGVVLFSYSSPFF